MPQSSYDDVVDQLWEKTKTDWHVRLSNVLTEPTCAYVDLYSDDDDLPQLKGFIGDADANNSIKTACEYMLRNLDTFYAEHPEKLPSSNLDSWAAKPARALSLMGKHGKSRRPLRTGGAHWIKNNF